MPALLPTDFYAEILWLGRVIDSAADLRAQPLDLLPLDFEGDALAGHGGHTRASCSRVLAQHPRGTRIANTRQLSLVSAEELEAIADRLGIAEFDPAWVGASIVLRGIPDFTHLPPSSRLQAPDGTTLVIDMENRPCVLPGRVIERQSPGHGKAFKEAAAGRRGVTAWVERPGALKTGDILRLHIPDQPVWSQLDAARGL
ncbi:MOSC domain-containing protein [Shimia sp.]|uniref:MOSC domain-containing protein n=1 Tax=Shimia sp. TaxID=1954381 RepID=UPI00356A39A5